MKSAYQIIRRPVITEKGLAIKENQNTLVFQVAPKATKTEIKQAVQTIFKVKVYSVRTATYPGKERRRGKLPATVRIGRRLMCGCGPGRRCRSTRRICRKQLAAVSFQRSAKATVEIRKKLTAES
jgi:large subunit ribosomal protein L23